jgi:hypothetical protein
MRTVPAPFASDLPPAVLDEALARLVAVDQAERAAAFAALVAEHPAHAAGLRALDESLRRTDKLLARGFTGPGLDDPERIGPYHVQRRIGEGAFGVVYLCAQYAPLRREVAVKVLRPGVGDRNTLARFDLERQVLVGLSHPCIANILEAGALPDGRPYFALEYVDGLPISRHCDQHRLPVEQRLSLFVALCEGVQHAHLRGVIHRDLKPANVLVALRDGRATPKIIDFGIAKALHRSDLPAVPSPTATGRVVGTPGYMSPEQAAGQVSAIDTRADVFALGVMLFELLAGTLPWPAGTSANDAEPPRPSQRLRRDTERVQALAALRATTPRPLVATVRGGLDWIVLKALRADPGQRYQSVKELADDVARYLRGDAVEAGPPAAIYRVRKFARRHRLALASSGLILASLIGGLLVSLSFYREAAQRAVDMTRALGREREARGAAAIGFDSALAAVDALLLRVADLRLADEPQTAEVRQALLDDAMGFYQRLLLEHGGDPRLHHEMLRARLAVAQLHERLGQPERARELTLAVLRELDAAEPPAEPAARQVRHERLGVACTLLGRLDASGQGDAAERWLQRAIVECTAAAQLAPAQPSRLLMQAQVELGDLLSDRGNSEGAIAAQTAAFGCAQALVAAAPDDPQARIELVACRARLLTAKFWRAPGQAKLDLAQLHADAQLLTQDEQRSGVPLERLTAIWLAVADGYNQQGQRRDELPALDVALRLRRRAVLRDPADPRHRRDLAAVLHRVARAASGAGNEARADAASREAIAVADELVRAYPTQPQFAWELAESCNQAVAVQLLRARRCALGGAQALARRAVALLRELPADFPERTRMRSLANALGNLANVRDANGDDSTAEWTEVLTLYDTIAARWGGRISDVVNRGRAVVRLATRRLAAGDHAAAAALVARAREFGAAPPEALPVARQFARVVRLDAQLAARRGDHAAVAAMGEELEPWVVDWRVARLAGEVWFAAWQAAGASAAPEEVAGYYAARADALLEAAAWSSARGPVEDSASESAVVARAEVAVLRAQLALGRGERAEAVALAERGLAQLAAVRADLHAFLLDDSIWAAGQALLVRTR